MFIGYNHNFHSGQSGQIICFNCQYTLHTSHSNYIWNIVNYFHINIILKYIEKEVDFLHDYKSTLQELAQTVKKSIIYEVVDEEGPAHNKKFTSIVKVDGIIMGRGTAGSKKASEQEAAKDALSKRAGIK